MYQSIILFPLLSSLIATNRLVGSKYGPLTSLLIKIVASLATLCVFFEVGINNSPVYINLGNWLDLGPILINWSFFFDSLTVSMFQPIVLISTLIQKYSIEYQGNDPA